jgi:ABC-type glycerol-3-phosphate transport system substrate-binding protein
VAHALAAAHRQGIVHGDVKPENVLLDDDGDAHVSDFGIAGGLARSRARRSEGRAAFAYLSPEQIRAEPETPATDVYALGVVTYEALTGRRPFGDGSLASRVERQRCDPLPSILDVRPELPPCIDEVISRATAKDPGARFADVLALAAAVRDALGRQGGVPSPTIASEVVNPYKGLRAFDESDAPNFFGRERMIERLVARLAEEVDGSRLLAVVGPSGSGKSSLVRAGLLPALRRGALPGSDAWFATELVPGIHPFDELEVALLRVAIDPPVDLAGLLTRDEGALPRLVGRMLPADEQTELLLVVDQLEELFTLTSSESERSAFLAAIAGATTDPQSRLRVVVTMRADFYDRPLLDAHFGPLLATRTEAITPLVPDELERAIAGPAERLGVSLEPSLVADMVADVADQPGALPLLQYSLTELFERRRGRTMTLEAYREIGGVSGALAGRAEDLFGRMDAVGQEACRQLFLRLVALGEGGEDTRRRVPRSELDELEVDRRSVDAAIEVFGRYRLLSFDRDECTREPTVELAHEALLRVWGRLREWIDEGREDVRTHRRLAASADEWVASGGDPSFLVTGARLERLASWASETRLAFDHREREFVQKSLKRHEAEIEAERTRHEHERSLERRSMRRMRALIAVLAAAALLASGLTAVAVSRGREAERRRVEAILGAEREMAGRLTAASVASLDADPAMSLRLALHSVDMMAALGEPVPSATVEALHWGLQEAGVEYPVADGPVAVVAGPLGMRGVYDLPLPELLELAGAYATPSLSPEECEQYFGDAACPSLPGRFPVNLAAEPIRAVPPAAPEKPLAGTEVTVFNVIDERVGLRAELARFTATTGIEVRLTAVSNVPGWIFESIATGNAPELAFFPQPGGVVRLADMGHLMDLGTYLDVEQLRRDQSPYLVSLGTVGPDGTWPSSEGATYGAFVGLNVKSLIWYPVPEFRDAGYDIPRTWDELLALGDEMAAEGRTPWCLGFVSGDSNGWPGTDWIENLVLTGAGPNVYDRWTFHEIPFDSRPVREAFERFGEIAFPEGSIYLGREGALETWAGLAQLPMIEDEPPGCWLYQYPTFNASFLPRGSVPRETDVFPFPPSTREFGRAVLGGGTMVGALADRPEVRELVRFLLGPAYGQEWARLGRTFLSANRRFDLENYSPWWRRQAVLVDTALANDTFRFDGSDLMAPEIGQGLFWDAMMEYLAEGPQSLDGILADLDAAWPDP